MDLNYSQIANAIGAQDAVRLLEDGDDPWEVAMEIGAMDRSFPRWWQLMDNNGEYDGNELVAAIRRYESILNSGASAESGKDDSKNQKVL